mmetsp:Transcript_11459/g.14187  ORF Transcript_11459/g.14187 Transcript_11459/m.14187 type:complete len:213 (+) Transcript_11459:854-1492(+)
MVKAIANTHACGERSQTSEGTQFPNTSTRQFGIWRRIECRRFCRPNPKLFSYIMHREQIKTHNHRTVFHQFRMTRKHSHKRCSSLTIPRLNFNNQLGVITNSLGRSQNVNQQRRPRPRLQWQRHNILKTQLLHFPRRVRTGRIERQPRKILVVGQNQFLVLRQCDVTLAQRHARRPRAFIRAEAVFEGPAVHAIIVAVEPAVRDEVLDLAVR